MTRMNRTVLLLLVLCFAVGLLALSVFAETPEAGTEQSPADANAKFLSGTGSYLLNTTLEEGDADGYWYTFKTDKAGILCIENSATMAYQIVVTCGDMEYKAFENGVNTNSLSTYRLAKGELVTIHLYAVADEDGKIPGGTIYANLFMASGSESNTVPIKSDVYRAYVASGDGVCYQDATRGGSFSGMGLIVEGDPEVIAQTVITINNVEYVDETGDGRILLTVQGSFSLRHPIHIRNDSGKAGAYTLTLTEPVREGVFENGTDHKLDYHPAVEPCHREGMLEYWHCPICDVYYADAEAKEVTNAKNLTIPADSQLQHFDAVAPGCHYLGNVEYWYCADCEGYWTDEEATELTNSLSVVLPATGGEVTHVPAREATCREEGNVEYWYCQHCQQVWQDQALTQLTNFKNVIIGRKEHSYEAGVCLVCGAELVVGDVNGDGNVTVRDARTLLRYIADLIGEDHINQAAADVNGDGKVNVRDARALLRQIAGLQ